MTPSLGILLDTPPTAGGGIARLALARATEAGIDPAPIWTAAGLTRDLVEDHRARISVESQIAVLNQVANALPDDLLGFHLGERFDLREIGLFYYVFASSTTLGDALARTERYGKVANESVGVQCGHEGDLYLRVRYVGVPRHADRHQIEFWATALLRVCRQVTDTDLRPIHVRLAHPRCASSAMIEAFLGCTIDFAAGHDEIVFPRRALSFPLLKADSYLNDLLIGYCEEVLARRHTRASSIRANVENSIVPLLPHGNAQVTVVARALGLSRRVLARRLAAEGLNFRSILEEMRRDLARRYLEDPNLPISRIAWLLGFQEAAAFTHAFKRWTGLTPTQARAQPPLGIDPPVEPPTASSSPASLRRR